MEELQPSWAGASLQPKLYSVVRELKKEGQSLFNCIHSIVADSSFIAELQGLYPGVPLLANLRCGAWYTAKPDGNCYFKSTDGHMSNWSFSTTRLNWHVAELAARKGGALIVDATRSSHKGGYPDALSKTIPIWAVVINRAVARLRASQQQQQQQQQKPEHVPGQQGQEQQHTNDVPCSSEGSGPAGTVVSAERGNVPQEGTNEGQSRAQTGPGARKGVRRQPSFGGWLDEASPEVTAEPGPGSGSGSGSGSGEEGGSGEGTRTEDAEDMQSAAEADVSGMQQEQAEQQAEQVWDTALHLPLWISSNERKQIEAKLEGWVDSLFAVGADVAGLAQVLQKPLRPLWISQSSLIWVDQVAQPSQLPFTPLVLLTASVPRPHERRQCSSAWLSTAPSPGAASPFAQANGEDGLGAEDMCATYLYVPGAGDDEESWAAGLTADLFWAHQRELLTAQPHEVQSVVKRLLQQAKAHGRSPSPSAPLAAGPHLENGCQGADANSNGQEANGSSSTTAASYNSCNSYVPKVATDEHHLRPQGCEISGPVHVQIVGQGLHKLGGTGILLGSFPAGAPPQVWEHVGAVLNVGLREHEGIAEEAGGWPLACPPPSSQPAGGSGGSKGKHGKKGGKAQQAWPQQPPMPQQQAENAQGHVPVITLSTQHTSTDGPAAPHIPQPGHSGQAQAEAAAAAARGGSCGDGTGLLEPFTGLCVREPGLLSARGNSDPLFGPSSSSSATATAGGPRPGYKPDPNQASWLSLEGVSTNGATGPAAVGSSAGPCSVAGSDAAAACAPAAHAMRSISAPCSSTGLLGHECGLNSRSQQQHPAPADPFLVAAAQELGLQPPGHQQACRAGISFTILGTGSEGEGEEETGSHEAGSGAHAASSGSPCGGLFADPAAAAAVLAEAMCRSNSSDGSNGGSNTASPSAVPYWHAAAQACPPPLRTASCDSCDLITVYSLGEAGVGGSPMTSVCSPSGHASTSGGGMGSAGGSACNSPGEGSPLGSPRGHAPRLPGASRGQRRASALSHASGPYDDPAHSAAASSHPGSEAGAAHAVADGSGMATSVSFASKEVVGGEDDQQQGQGQGQGGNHCQRKQQLQQQEEEAAGSFQFAPHDALLDVTPPDYISCPLQISPHEIQEMRAECEAHDAAVAKGAHCPSRYCLMPWAVVDGEGHAQPSMIPLPPQLAAIGQAMGCPVVTEGDVTGKQAGHASCGCEPGQGTGAAGLQQQGHQGVSSQQQQRNCHPQEHQHRQGTHQPAGPQGHRGKGGAHSLLTDALANCWDAKAQQQQSADHSQHQGQAQAGPNQNQPQHQQHTEVVQGQQGPPQAVLDGPQWGRYLWLPVRNSKQDRQALASALGPAVSFLSHHLGQGRAVLIHDDDGLDQSVCVALALLLACYSPASAGPGEGHGGSSHAEGGGAGPGSATGGGVPGQPQLLQALSWSPETGDVTPPEEVTKHSVRQRLAFVAQCYPQARPTRGLLKQVYSFFHPQDAAAGGDD